MEKNNGIEDQEIWKCSFALACFIYSITDREAFAYRPVMKQRVRKLMVKVLSSIIESYEAEEPVEAGAFLRNSAISLRDLRQELISAYRFDCLDFQEFSRAREKCLRLKELILAPEMEQRGVGVG